MAGLLGSSIGATKELVLGVCAVDLGGMAVFDIGATLIRLGYSLGLLLAVVLLGIILGGPALALLALQEGWAASI